MSERLWAPWRLEYVAGGDAGGCIFCDKPALSDDDALILHRGRRAFAVLNLWQLADDSITALTAAMAPHGFNCGMNLGRVAGAGVEGHLHMHVVPRWNGDTNFMPVLADTRVMPEHLSRTLEKLRAAWPA